MATESKESVREEAFVPKSGLTVRSLLAIIYGAIILQPISLWLFMLTGQIPGVAIIIALLVSEIAIMAGKPLTRQETFIIISSSVIYIGTFIGLIYNVYFADMPLVRSYGISKQIPAWYAPPNPQEILLLRTFFTPGFWLPISISVVTLFLGFFADLGLGLYARELYIKQQKLPFPMAEVGAQGALTLSEREPTRMDIFSIGMIISLIYSFLLYGLPIVTEAIFRGYSVSFIPIPFADMTYTFELIMPGASFGIATDPLTFATGFVVPFPVVVSMFIGSFSIYFVGNHLMQSYGLWTKWLPGMTAMDSYTRSMLDLWVSPLIGLSLAAAILPLIRRPKVFLRSLASLRHIGSGSSSARLPGELSPLFHLPVWLLCSIISLAIFHYLVPDFPIILFALLSLGFGFLGGLVATYAIGETGFGLVVPYVRESATLYSYTMGYEGISVWFAPLVISTAGAGGWPQGFKVCDLTGTTIKSYIIAYTIGVILSVITAFIFTSILWYMSPIPSRAYPATQLSWPIQASYQLLWVTRSLEVFKPMYMAVSFVFLTIVYAVAELFHIPVSIIGLATGAGTALPFTFTLLMGGIAGQILQSYIGAKFWNNYRAVLVAGVSAGAGIAVGISVGISTMLRGLWLLPF